MPKKPTDDKPATVPAKAPAPKAKVPPKPTPAHPTPYGAKAQNNKGNKVQPARQRMQRHQGR